ncbi:hypothetical protein PbJCM13498_13340 [Prolixibacter bellariivorans]|uniref:PqqD family protein n=1 Tax=Prolixibacter bellariivorans TaxID=314319 RepID=A0A5M4AXW6_9BACT|nr:PqqD family protein [Prolixibacter bellariivorans]GET32471.1 hypothetical protein PbJCM13498_13340 [Prolixibacter bellariivorans]
MRIKKSVAVSENGFVFDSSTGDSFNLNSIGREIVELMKNGSEQSEITQKIVERYEVEPAIFEQNLMDFQSMLKQFNLMEE